jgi:hypothetical protein
MKVPWVSVSQSSKRLSKPTAERSRSRANKVMAQPSSLPSRARCGREQDAARPFSRSTFREISKRTRNYVIRPDMELPQKTPDHKNCCTDNARAELQLAESVPQTLVITCGISAKLSTQITLTPIFSKDLDSTSSKRFRITESLLSRAPVAGSFLGKIA